MQTTSSEILDIVDKNDVVIGAATRGDIHARGLMHRSVHVLVFDGEGSVLLQKRSMQKDQCAGMWDTSCAGHVESGDSYQDTAPRELQEELGLELTASPSEPLRELFKMNPTEDNGHEFAKVYAIDHNGPFVAAEDEIDELRWFSFAKVDSWVEEISSAQDKRSQDLTSGFIEIWCRFREANG